METATKLGIIICDRYRTCAGGKCLRAMRNREGAFQRYKGNEIELVGYSTCDGCPGGNIEYVGEEMVKNGAQVIHLATGLVVGYPPCPYIQTFQAFLEKRYNVKVVVGTHPIPKNTWRCTAS
jgi:predicted metal-binding protein